MFSFIYKGWIRKHTIILLLFIITLIALWFSTQMHTVQEGLLDTITKEQLRRKYSFFDIYTYTPNITNFKIRTIRKPNTSASQFINVILFTESNSLKYIEFDEQTERPDMKWFDANADIKDDIKLPNVTEYEYIQAGGGSLQYSFIVLEGNQIKSYPFNLETNMYTTGNILSGNIQNIQSFSIEYAKSSGKEYTFNLMTDDGYKRGSYDGSTIIIDKYEKGPNSGELIENKDISGTLTTIYKNKKLSTISLFRTNEMGSQKPFGMGLIPGNDDSGRIFLSVGDLPIVNQLQFDDKLEQGDYNIIDGILNHIDTKIIGVNEYKGYVYIIGQFKGYNDANNVSDNTNLELMKIKVDNNNILYVDSIITLSKKDKDAIIIQPSKKFDIHALTNILVLDHQIIVNVENQTHIIKDGSMDPNYIIPEHRPKSKSAWSYVTESIVPKQNMVIQNTTITFDIQEIFKSDTPTESTEVSTDVSTEDFPNIVVYGIGIFYGDDIESADAIQSQQPTTFIRSFKLLKDDNILDDGFKFGLWDEKNIQAINPSKTQYYDLVDPLYVKLKNSTKEQQISLHVDKLYDTNTNKDITNSIDLSLVNIQKITIIYREVEKGAEPEAESENEQCNVDSIDEQINTLSSEFATLEQTLTQPNTTCETELDKYKELRERFNILNATIQNDGFDETKLSELLTTVTNVSNICMAHINLENIDELKKNNNELIDKLKETQDNIHQTKRYNVQDRLKLLHNKVQNAINNKDGWNQTAQMYGHHLGHNSVANSLVNNHINHLQTKVEKLKQSEQFDLDMYKKSVNDLKNRFTQTNSEISCPDSDFNYLINKYNKEAKKYERYAEYKKNEMYS